MEELVGSYGSKKRHISAKTGGERPPDQAFTGRRSGDGSR